MDRISSAAFRTEVEFTLPKGFIDEAGVLHRRGMMRLDTLRSEVRLFPSVSRAHLIRPPFALS